MPKPLSPTAVPQGSGSPSRVVSPNLIRAANIPVWGQPLAKDIEMVSWDINNIYKKLSSDVPNIAATTTTANSTGSAGAWVDWTPKIVSGLAALTPIRARWIRMGPVIHFGLRVNVTVAASTQIFAFSGPPVAMASLWDYWACTAYWQATFDTLIAALSGSDGSITVRWVKNQNFPTTASDVYIAGTYQCA
jgi:hypothetical protein